MYYYYEIYTKNPETKECGWEIEIGWVSVDHVSIGAHRTELDEAKARVVEHYPLFDCFIQIYQAIPSNSDFQNSAFIS